MNKKVLYIDMDGVLVDFNKAITNFLDIHPHLKDKFKDCPDHIPGIFRNPPPIDGLLMLLKNYTIVVSMICS